MAVQINIRLSDELAADLDRWASDLRVERSTLLRDVVAEAITARREGRASFARPETPGPGDLQRLVAKLDEQTTELDRILRQNAKRDAELARQAREDTRGVSEARDAIVADVVAALRAALEVIHGELVRTREELVALMGRLPQLIALDAWLDRIESLARVPRTKTVNNIGLGDWTWPMLAGAGLVLTVTGMFAFALLAAILPERWVELRYANKLLGGGDRAICRLVDYHYETGLIGCGVQTSGRTVTVTATTPRPDRTGR